MKRTALELTDARLRIPVNDGVMQFISTRGSSAHTDVGIPLVEIGKELEGAHFYCPSFKSCMYVVLHTDDFRIFAMAYGMHGLAFRLAPSEVSAAVADGGTVEPALGPDWVAFQAYDARGITGTHDRLRRWAARALAGT